MRFRESFMVCVSILFCIIESMIFFCFCLKFEAFYRLEPFCDYFFLVLSSSSGFFWEVGMNESFLFFYPNRANPPDQTVNRPNRHPTKPKV